MEKIKNVFSSTSSATAKLSKAFRFDGNHNVLRRTQTNTFGAGGGGGNPFLDGPVLEEPSLPKAHLIIHVVAIFFTFLAICTMGAVASFQSKWFSVTGGTGFVIFLLLCGFLLSAFLIVVPIVYDRWDRLKRPAQFLHQTRTTFILHAFGTFILLLCAFIVTISAWTAKGCKNADDDPHADLGDDFKNGLKDWCTTKKASAIFDWFAFGAWAGLLVMAALIFRRERRQNQRTEPSFIPPSENGVSYSNILAADDDRYADKTEQANPFAGPGAEVAAVGHNRVDSAIEAPSGGYGGAMARPSVDAYGAFDGDMPGHGVGGGGNGGADEPSRTMQLAYNDPYAQIRASLMTNPSASGGYGQPAHQQSQPQPQNLYGNGGLPNPPSYGGYR